MNRRSFGVAFASLSAAAFLAMPLSSRAAEETAEAMIKGLCDEVLTAIRADKSLQRGDVTGIGALVDRRVMPHVNFQRMTASATGPTWRQATPEQQKRLQDEFKILLVRAYAGALAQIDDQTITVKPGRAAPGDSDVVVRTEIRGRSDPIQLDYRVEKTAGAWRIYNINVLGVWLVETYRSQFAQEISAHGVDGLINALVERNKANTRRG